MTMKEEMKKRVLFYDSLIEGLGDVMQDIATAGYTNEEGKWVTPEWANDALKKVVLARIELQEVYKMFCDIPIVN